MHIWPKQRCGRCPLIGESANDVTPRSGLPLKASYTKKSSYLLRQERAFLERFARLRFREFEFRGFLGKRRIVSFGWRYDFNTRELQKAEEIPDFLLELRVTAEGFANIHSNQLQQVLVTEYALGAGIGWHRDRPEFEHVIGVSLLSPCLFRLRRKRGNGWERASIELQPRSAYLLISSDSAYNVLPLTMRRSDRTKAIIPPADEVLGSPLPIRTFTRPRHQLPARNFWYDEASSAGGET